METGTSKSLLPKRKKLPSLADPPEPLLNFLTAGTREARDFRNNIRKYNQAFQMTSFGCGQQVVLPGFFPTFKVQGQVYHRIGSLLSAEEGTDPKFLQIYFLGDSDAEAARRCSVIQDINELTVRSLQDMLHSYNPYVRDFKTAFENMHLDNHRVHIRADKTPPGEHPRRFNAPSGNEVAVVLVGQELGKHDILLRKRDDQVQRVSVTHRSYDLLQYPLLFVNGEDGYCITNMQTNPVTGLLTTKNISAMTFHAY